MRLNEQLLEQIARATLEMIERQSTKDEKNVEKNRKGTCQKLENRQ